MEASKYGAHALTSTPIKGFPSTNIQGRRFLGIRVNKEFNR